MTDTIVFTYTERVVMLGVTYWSVRLGGRYIGRITGTAGSWYVCGDPTKFSTRDEAADHILETRRP